MNPEPCDTELSSLVSKMVLRPKISVFLFGLFLTSIILHSRVIPQTNENISTMPHPEKITLVHAVMCEGIDEYSPLNPSVVFSIRIGKVSCFTSFDHVPEETYIYHKWYHKDRLSTQKKLRLRSPRWATFSSIQLREADKGPWRIEVTDSNDNQLHVLRFSISD